MNAAWPIPIAESEQIEQAVLDAALGIENEETRVAFLRQVFVGDAAKIREMEDLVDSSRRAAEILHDCREARAELAGIATGSFAVTQDTDPAFAENEAEGGRVGRYLLGKKLGDGSYGEVFEALDADGGTRRLAIKIIRRGMDTEAVVARFSLERDALALMDHPNIARVTDAGSTPRGRPYFVMDLVGPERITSYCESHKLGFRERLGLFLQVCSAIQHAHQKGIIHRDIKPSNILVSETGGKPLPQVIDFGVAKAARGSGAGQGTLTSSDQMLGTPAYMSPEQVDLTGVDVDTRADVYGLGALLYELLAGRPPFDPAVLNRGGWAVMRRTILFENPAKPSAVVAGNMTGEPQAGRPSLAVLRGGLDWIVMKALEKDRKRRYQTVGALMEDIERFQSHQPVQARRPSRLYVAGCFVRRNRAACFSAGAAILTLVVATAVTGRLYRSERIATHGERMALAEQTRLRRIAEDHAAAAEVARNEETRQRMRVEAAMAEQQRLLAESNAREKLSLAAILASMGQSEQAEHLLRPNQPGNVPPIQAAALLIRTVGARNAVEGNWEEAARCFSLLIRAGLFLPEDRDGAPPGIDLLLPGPAMLEAGDLAGYEAYRAEIVRRWAGHPAAGAGVIAAERLIKAACLCPVPPAMIESLAPMAADLAAAMKRGESAYPLAVPWGTFALALYHFRSGDHQSCMRWAELSLHDRAVLTADREASLRSMMAVSLLESGNLEGARRELGEATALFDSGRVRAPADQLVAGALDQPTWWDCVMARCLHREAVERVPAG
jgi:hypothetical protein